MLIVENPDSRFDHGDYFIDDESGQVFSESPHYPRFVHGIDVVLYGTGGLPAKEGLRYLDGGEGEKNLGEDLLYKGSSDNFLQTAIYPEDVPKFVHRINAWRIVTQNIVYARRENGLFEARRPSETQYNWARYILESSGIMHTRASQNVQA